MEESCCDAYSKSLDIPLKRSNRVSLLSNLIFSASASMQYLVIALVVWYGSHLISKFELSTMAFFVCLFVGIYLMLFLTLS